MKIKFFELKFLITDTFYSYVTINNHSFEEASSMCYEKFEEYVNSDSIDGIIAISNIVDLQITYDVRFTEYDIKQINRLFELIRIIPIHKVLDETEYEYLEFDIKFIKNRCHLHGYNN